MTRSCIVQQLADHKGESSRNGRSRDQWVTRTSALLRLRRTEPSSGNCLRRSAHGVAPCAETRATRGASVAPRGTSTPGATARRGLCGSIADRPASGRQPRGDWRFAMLTQDCDAEGCLRLRRLPTLAEATVIREVLGIRKRAELSPEELERRRTIGKRLARRAGRANGGAPLPA